MADWRPLPHNLKTKEFADWLASALEREGWSHFVRREVEDWLYQKTGRTVLPRQSA